MFNMGKMMKQVQDMQKNMEAAQKELESQIFTGQAAGGLVQVQINGKGFCHSLNLDPSLLQEDASLLADLILTAFNQAKENLESKSQDQMKSITGGLNLPAGMKLPF